MQVMKMITRIRYASYKPQNGFESPFHPYKLGNYASKLPGNFPANTQGLRFISTNMGKLRKLDNDIGSTKEERVEDDSTPGAGSGGSSKFKFSIWAKCLLGSVLSFLFPIWKAKWANFKRIEGEAEVVVKVAENAAEVVEKIATATENMSAEVAEKLPDESKLKKAAVLVEHVSEITAQDAHATTQFIHQVEAIKHDLDGLDALVEPIVQKMVKQGPQEK